MASDVSHRREVCREEVRLEGGTMAIGDAPGQGIDLDEEAIARFPYEPRDLRHYTGQLTDIRLKDATSYF